MPADCLQGQEAFEEALTAAPAPVRLAGDMPISRCVELASSAADMQNVGILVVNVAEDLKQQAADGDQTAARELGYLVGAVQRGAERTNGTHLELAFRVSRVAGALRDPSPALTDALTDGIAAGERTG
ncbi:MAG TPA: hypothetical protein VGW11_07030 [Solirubrobacteraceae bacterium]|nr:hypothetical protein [Solirubrobacteraceae bacterium]